MRSRVETHPAGASIFRGNGVNILKKLPFIFKNTGVFESCAVIHARNVATKYASTAPGEPTYKYVFAVDGISFHTPIVTKRYLPFFSPRSQAGYAPRGPQNTCA